jgi:TPR repeat protein
MMALNRLFAGRSARPFAIAVVLSLAPPLFGASAGPGALTAGEQAYARHDYVRAASLLRAEAERGSPDAQTYLGFMYQNGFGVPQDFVVAAGWLNQAAQQGQPTAQFLLGMAFDKGHGVPQDWIQAETWLILATSQAGARERDYWARLRDAVAQKLTLDQLAEARRRAYSWSIPVRRGGAFGAPF